MDLCISKIYLKGIEKMANSISMWAQGIIIAIIVGSIIQMLLPENKNKKYIKVIIGVYILFCIISPVIGKDLKFNELELDKYIDIEQTNETEENNIYDENIKQTFKNKIILNIKSQLKARGYESNNIQIDINDECKILKIRITDIIEYKENNTDEENKISNISINKIDAGSERKENIEDKKANGIATSDKNSIIDYLIENYQIDKKNIIIE